MVDWSTLMKNPAPIPTTSAPLKPWIIYTRVSTDEQALHGVSLDAQQEQCRAMLTAMRLPMREAIVDDGYSGETIAKRPGMRRIVEMMEARSIGGVVIARLDRLTRSVTDMDFLIRKINETETGLLSVGETIDTRTPNGRMFVYLSGLFAQWEREKIADRVRVGMAHIRSKGFFCGGRIPPGCMLEGDKGKRRLVRGPHADVISQAWPMVKAGSSLTDVSDFLNRSGVPLRGNRNASKTWGAIQVSRLLRSDSVIGVLIDAATFAEVRTTIDARRNPFRPHGEPLPSHKTERVWIGAGILRCSACGASLCGLHARSQTGTKYPYLRCVERGKGRCKAKDLPAEPVERALIAGAVYATRRHGDYAERMTTIARHAQGQAQPIMERRAACEKQAANLRHKRGTLIDLCGEPGVVNKVLAVNINEVQAKLDATEMEIARCDGELAACRLTEQEAETIADGVRRFLADVPTLPAEQQRQALLRIVKTARFDVANVNQPTLHLELFMPPGNTPSTPGEGAGGEFVQNTVLVLPTRFELVSPE
jgi:DNA invertase Pin-like site-specific DNA recombinase